ncbi:hypothetical protein EUX98_g4638 [Antrodiella citrinella]|uniref:Uncharacterized protein n=1 Tax=Antrodiella citrinella TaxID=2447956 RepID=A0A4S4MW94_9APHY|nr:hypothetical protein EUX98_g4638 [Antrodiella citrinella]
MSSSFSYLQHPREAFDLLSPLHLGPDPLPNFAPVNVGAPLPRRALKPVPLPDVDAVAMPGDHLFESVESLPLPQDPEPEQGGSELERRRKEVDEDEDERNAFAQHHRYEHESTHTASKVALAKAPFYSELDVQADAYGRRNRSRLDTRPQRLTYVDDSLNYNHLNLPTNHSSSSASASYLSSAGSSRRPQGRLSNTGPGLKRLPTWKATSGSGSAGGSEGSTKTQTQNEVYESVSCMPGCEGYSFEVRRGLRLLL